MKVCTFCPTDDLLFSPMLRENSPESRHLKTDSVKDSVVMQILESLGKFRLPPPPPILQTSYVQFGGTWVFTRTE